MPTLTDFRRLRTDCRRLDVSVSNLLERARVFAEIVNDRPKLDWMILEERGYAMEGDIPDYRLSRATLTIKAGGVWRPAQWLSTAVQQQKSRVAIRLSVDDLQVALANQTADAIGIPVPSGPFRQFLYDTVESHQSRMEVAKEAIGVILQRIRSSLLEWIETADEDVQAALEGVSDRPGLYTPKAKQRVFIVHGHDPDAVNEVKLVLIRLGYDPISLQEHPSGAETIIERLERESDVVFAIILLTPDDLAGSRKELEESKESERMKKLKARARQNVIFEYGYFIKKLSPGRVFPLKKGEVEQPSNLGGTTPYDFAKDWQKALVITMIKAGLEADYRNLL